MNKNSKSKYIYLSPVIIYAIVLILFPIIYILFLSFQTSDNYGGIIYSLTLNNYLKIFDIVYLRVLYKSACIAIITTFICILIAYPFSIFISEKKANTQKILITLVMIPFLTNSLIRTYGWIVLLRKEGVFNSVLRSLNLIDNPISFMYNNLGVFIGLVYTLLPFMILPVYSSVSKIDKKVLEAAEDLGANSYQKFMKVILPQTLPGIFNGSLMVFIPAIGMFFIADLLGGGKIMLIGNLIKNQFLVSRNWPFGAAISIFLIVITFILVKFYKKSGCNMDDLGGF